jgi:hypothetical protein
MTAVLESTIYKLCSIGASHYYNLFIQTQGLCKTNLNLSRKSSGEGAKRNLVWTLIRNLKIVIGRESFQWNVRIHCAFKNTIQDIVYLLALPLQFWITSNSCNVIQYMQYSGLL